MGRLPDTVYHELFHETNNSELDSLTEQCLPLICCTLEVLISCQLADQVVNGKFFAPSAAVMKETEKSPMTNFVSERDFAKLDKHPVKKPNISTISLTGLVLFQNNRTSVWLKSLSEADRSMYMAKAQTSTSNG